MREVVRQMVVTLALEEPSLVLVRDVGQWIRYVSRGVYCWARRVPCRLFR